MKIIRFSLGNKTGYGILDNHTIKAIQGSPFQKIQYSGVILNLNEVKLLSPCMPSKIVCLGVNYRSHAGEMNLQLPPSPLIFLKPRRNPGEQVWPIKYSKGRKRTSKGTAFRAF